MLSLFRAQFEFETENLILFTVIQEINLNLFHLSLFCSQEQKDEV